MIQKASQPVVVIEAIKLLEGKIVKKCDAIWTTFSPEALQITRLMNKRGMSEQDALQRIHAQPPQEQKIAGANTVIRNIVFDDT
jgi:dephospho-CoA kinase